MINMKLPYRQRAMHPFTIMKSLYNVGVGHFPKYKWIGFTSYYAVVILQTTDQSL